MDGANGSHVVMPAAIEAHDVGTQGKEDLFFLIGCKCVLNDGQTTQGTCLVGAFRKRDKLLLSRTKQLR